MTCKTCKSCDAEVDPLAEFPGTLCLTCWSRTPEANRPMSADELAQMWGAPKPKRRKS